MPFGVADADSRDATRCEKRGSAAGSIQTALAISNLAKEGTTVTLGVVKAGDAQRTAIQVAVARRVVRT